MGKRNSQLKICATVLPTKMYNKLKGLGETFLQFLTCICLTAGVNILTPSDS